MSSSSVIEAPPFHVRTYVHAEELFIYGVNVLAKEFSLGSDSRI
jgi:hypothetical protein